MTFIRDTTLDGLLGGRITIEQPREGFRAAIDPVFLAAAMAAAPGSRVLDAGTGVGTAALCLATRLPEVSVVGLERDSDLAALAHANVARNHLEGRVTILNRAIGAGTARVRSPRSVPGDSVPGDSDPESFVRSDAGGGGVLETGFDAVMMNPPYLRDHTATLAADARTAAACGEGDTPLAAWIAFAAARLRPKGEIVLIHRADRLDDLVAGLRGRFGGIALLPLWPRAGVDARRIIVRARLGSRAPARLLPGLVLHGPDNRFTPEAERILRDTAAIGP